ncbi:MtrAB system histidine kinase MtrB [Microbacterium sp. X-17]|uniref:MtrAB system histidine kinase MtrB n=1 Tax=Microbacterium sp. X-17 TaxID=3144404 RepID=UPI0031F50230
MRVRDLPRALLALWQRSLRFRTVLITVALVALAILVAGIWTALAIQNDLFDSRKEQALLSAQRATQVAQTTLDAAETQGESILLRNVMNSLVTTLAQPAGTDMYAVLRTQTSASTLAPQGFTVGLSESDISPELRTRVQTSDAQNQWWQSAALTMPDGSTAAGIIVGHRLTVPSAGDYELYFAYDLSTASQTLQFVQVTLWIVGCVLVLLVGAIAWFVLRSVTVPIRETAETSAKLAAGDLAVRVHVHGDDELASLSRSFNAMADSIQSQIKELADLSLVQQRFVSDVSHELRTPLTTIRLAADMLNDRRDDFDPSTARAAELLHAQVERFELLLIDLLEISRYDAGSIQLEREPTSLAHLTEDVIASMRQLAERHGVDIRLVAPGGYSPVDMDPRRVRRIVRNLLGNAIEHSEGRPVVVTVDSNQDAVAIGVRDHGPGLAPEHVERVFDRFWRADPARARTIGGTGLGLSIALTDARLHGGTLTVWSEPGRGANFVLTLPRGEGALAGPSPLSADPGEGGPGDILVHTQPISVVTENGGGAS